MLALFASVAFALVYNERAIPRHSILKTYRASGTFLMYFTWMVGNQTPSVLVACLCNRENRQRLSDHGFVDDNTHAIQLLALGQNRRSSKREQYHDSYDLHRGGSESIGVSCESGCVKGLYSVIW